MREGATATASDRPHRWLLAGAIVLAAAGVVAALFVVPRLLYPPLPASRFAGVAADKRIELETNRLKLQNDARATLLQALAGGVLLLGAYFTWRQLRATLEGQVTDRYTKAVEQLRPDNQPEVAFGGIYDLGRVARDSSYYRLIIAEILTAYVRTHAPWPPIGPDQHKAKDSRTLQWRAANVQAALAVLGGPTFDMELDLRGTDLRNADLKGAKFKDVRLYGANLQGARLQGTDLQDARFYDANLQGAQLQRADLRGARLNGANFQGAQFDRATLRGALADGTTKWPYDGFDASAAGVVLPSEGPTADRPP
jgi:hypothetical protein